MEQDYQLFKFSNNLMEGLKLLDKETLDQITNHETYLSDFDINFRLLQCVLDNYTSFEDELKQCLSGNHFSNQNLINVVSLPQLNRITNKCLLNILTAFKMMIEHLEARVKRDFGKNSVEIGVLKKAQSDEFDNNFSYAFCYKLRNYIQHCSIPQITFNINQHMDDSSNQPTCSLTIDIHRDNLLNSYNEWGSIVRPLLEKQEQKLCLLSILDDLRKSLINIFEKIKGLISYDKAQEARKYILNFINEDSQYVGQDYGVCTFTENLNKGLQINTQILKTSLFESLISFDNLINSA